MSYKIIVSRYNENIDWLNAEIDNCIIYNKGNKLNIINEILLENVGRESETYLNYIIENYNNLPDVIVFTQARISDHVHYQNNNVNYLINLKNEALLNNKSEPNIKNFQNTGPWQWSKNFNSLDGNYNNNDVYKNNNKMPFIEWFTKNIQPNFPEPIYIYSNGILQLKKN